ncbi:hypothetical protein MMC08_006750 [Hypocenomyce scalaris]|nr:hypothetical protein [Hypocenomyce scalaris]
MPPAIIENVIVVGAGGNLGPYIVAALHSAKSFNISVLSRPSSTSSFPSYVNVFRSDYTESSLLQAFEGQDAVVSVVGGPAIADQRKLIDAAEKAGVKRFLPSEYGCNTNNEGTLRVVPLLRGKANTTAYLKEKARANPQFTWTSLITGPFFDRGLQTGFLGFNIADSTATIYDSGEQAGSVTNMSTIGMAIARILSKPEETANQYLYIASHTTSQNAILAAFEKVTGKKWTVHESTTGAAMQEGAEKISRGDLSGFGKLILAATYGKGCGNKFDTDQTLANGLLGLPEESLEGDIRDVVEGKKPKLP